MGCAVSGPTLHPLDRVRWTCRDATLLDERGQVVFRLGGVEAPETWSEAAVGIVASRYFRGGERGERSVRELLERVGGTLARWVVAQGLAGPGYEADLLDLLVAQRGAFNSPVWFNVGVDERPQCSACFILGVQDTLASILDLARIEGLIFQRGSGAGTNLSTLRSSREPLAGGGTASGPVSFMRGYDAFAGVVKSGGRTRRAAKMQILDAGHPDILDFVQCKAKEERKARALLAAGFGGGLDGDASRSVAFQNSNLSVRAPDAFFEAVERGGAWTTRAVTTGEEAGTLPARDLLRAIAEGAWECGDPGVQYDGAIQAWNPCPSVGRIAASNPCSEYLFLDDTACNLASLNLLRFLRDDGTFDIAAYRRDIGILFRAMEAIVDRASYPTERIADRSRRFRPLGLGYSNLGALLMALGLPYDSDEARGWAGALTALLTGEAYRVSAEIAAARGACDGFGKEFLAVLERHQSSIPGGRGGVVEAARESWAAAIALARRHGVRNAQATVIAPTGTISFLMDCDTTGIEPDLALVKYKRLAGGGRLRLVNHVMGRALHRLGYDAAAAAGIQRHVEREETIEGAPGLRDEHRPVFRCAHEIPPEGHLAMMAAVQPFVSGGISKTVNLPAAATPGDIEDLYVSAWRLGLKSLSIYRDSSKAAAPLSCVCE